MSIQNLILIQLLIDVLLCLLLVFFFWQMNRRGGEKKGPDLTGADREQFQKFIEESRKLSAEFVASLEEGRKNLKSLAFALDERERRLRELLERSERLLNRESGTQKTAVGEETDPYREVLKMVDAGLSAQEVADRLGMTAGEIELIKNLKRRKPQETS
ncbi:MAG TPA: DUF2802 domain-containing protein [Syntrophales bacterium]|nr:DUF2802 domain-containing protein [Syntrophales bacterium]